MLSGAPRVRKYSVVSRNNDRFKIDMKDERLMLCYSIAPLGAAYISAHTACGVLASKLRHSERNAGSLQAPMCHKNTVHAAFCCTLGGATSVR